LYKAEYFYAGVFTLLVVFYLYYAKKFYDEDNWFKNQFTKLKNGIKNLGQRIVQSLTPAPLGSPA